MEIELEKVKTAVESGIDACRAGYSSERTLLLETADGIQVQVIVTADPDDLIE